MAANTVKCGFCAKITKYKCLNCQLPACNRCTKFEENEEICGWQAGESVGYCMECQLVQDEGKNVEKSQIMNDSDTPFENFDGFDHESCESERLTPLPLEGALSSESHEHEYDSDASCQAKCAKKKSGKKAGRKTMWSDNTLDDFVDIITASEYYKKKLIFTNTKNQKNGIIYANILTELRSRCDKRKEKVDFSIVQMRNKFKKCISECKHAAMTIKTATGINRFQEGKGYGAWFKQLFPLVQSRDSCQPEMAVEPSCSSSTSTSTCNTSNNSLDDLEEDEPASLNKEAVVKSFVPVKKRKLSAKDRIGEAVKLLNTLVENDPSKELIRFMQDEAEKSRKHELEMTKLMLSATAPPSQPTESVRAPSAMQLWPQDYNNPGSLHLQYPMTYQAYPVSTDGFATPTQTYRINTSAPNEIGKHYHTL